MSSSGGNLAAIGSLKASQLDPPIPIVFQLLIVPVTDNTASETNDRQKSWKENEKTPWLGPERMHWFVNNYLPNKEDWTKWDASPIFAPDELAAKSPKTWIAVCEMDILRDEGIAYGEKLKKLGVEVETKVYKGAPHPIMAMDGYVQLFNILRRLMPRTVACQSGRRWSRTRQKPLRRLSSNLLTL